MVEEEGGAVGIGVAAKEGLLVVCWKSCVGTHTLMRSCTRLLGSEAIVGDLG